MFQPLDKSTPGFLQSQQSQQFNASFPRPPPPAPPPMMQVPPRGFTQGNNFRPAFENATSSQLARPPPVNMLNNQFMPGFPMPLPTIPSVPLVAKPSPKNGPIFVGHLFKPPMTDAVDWVHEILFNKTYFVEGMHIVPNKLTVPNLILEGKTIPDMYTRSFDMSVYGRHCKNATPLKHIISVKVTGGVEWLPFLTEMEEASAFHVDYLAIPGDFESISLIIHGHEVSSLMEIEPPQLPLPSFYEEFTAPLLRMAPNDTSEEKASNAVIYNLSTSKSLMPSFFEQINRPLADLMDTSLMTFVESRLGCAGTLKLRQEVIQELGDMASMLEHVSQMNALRTRDAFRSLAGNLKLSLERATTSDWKEVDEVALSTLCKTLSEMLSMLRCNFALLKVPSEQEDTRAEILHDIASYLLECCHSVLVRYIYVYFDYDAVNILGYMHRFIRRRPSCSIDWADLLCSHYCFSRSRSFQRTSLRKSFFAFLMAHFTLRSPRSSWSRRALRRTQS